mmetsp:Transcript_18261/g.49073  ORF Transcript_18261/g.49073 Transcript_18261/m.49073 type:complete len:226 (+) Transcript_18261:798-1475(+)
MGVAEDVRELLAPTSFIELRSVQAVLTCIRVEPSALARARRRAVVQPHLTPDVVCDIVHPTCWVTTGSSDQREAVGPLPAAPALFIKQPGRVVESCEALHVLADVALVQLGHVRSILAFLRRWLGATQLLGCISTLTALWGVHPLEELVLEPHQQLFHETELIARILLCHFERRLVQTEQWYFSECLHLHLRILVDLHLGPMSEGLVEHLLCRPLQLGVQTLHLE